VRGEQDGLLLLSRGDALALSSWREIEPGKVVSARVTAVNTGGLELKVGPLPAFLPASHVDLKRVDDLSQYLNQTLVCEVLEVDPEKRRVLLSRRSVLERERERARDEQVAGLAPGQVVRGKVVRLESFGAFVEIAPGLEGLLHVSNVSRKRVEKVEDELEVGQTLELLVLSVEQGGKRIGLGRKQLEANPWDELSARLPLGTVVEGRVTRVAEFGAFVEVLPGIEGLVHVSQLARDRLRRARDAAKVGETFPVRVLAVEPERERLSLTRLDPHGALLGTEEAADTDRIVEEIERSRNTAIGTNLGDLLKRAKRD
jgi:small subunit ribosomal protein S1